MLSKRSGLVFLLIPCLLLAGCGAGAEEEPPVSQTEQANQNNSGEPEVDISEELTVEAREVEPKNTGEGSEAEESSSGPEAESEPEDESQPEDESEPEETVPGLPGALLNGTQFAEGDEPLRVTYADAFYYEPVSDALLDYMTGTSYPELSEGEYLEITPEDLRYVHVLHYDFNAEVAEGELICNKAIAQDLVEIFYELYENEYQIEQIHLVDEYDGDDTASMTANNTSCFNYRNVPNSGSLSKHALGRAIDINPLYNPYITYNSDGSTNCSPEEGWAYADRSADFAHKIDTTDLCYQVFTAHGFTWGGSWNSSKDYQHFQKE